MLDAGCSPDDRDKLSCVPLHVALLRKEADGTVRTLLDAGADARAVNGAGMSPLHVAAVNWPVAIRTLVRAGADAHTQTVSGDTPFSLAIRERQVRTLSALMDVKAHVPPPLDVHTTLSVGHAHASVSEWVWS
jgi:ankyrin repeat protein